MELEERLTSALADQGQIVREIGRGGMVLDAFYISSHLFLTFSPITFIIL